MMRRSPMKRTGFKRKATTGGQRAVRRPMKSKGRPAPTAAEKRHMAKVAGLGCIVCRNLGFLDTPAELHHPRFLAGAGQKASNMDVIPLCPTHHRIGGLGVAFHAGRQSFEAAYGTEAELLTQTKALLGGALSESST